MASNKIYEIINEKIKSRLEDALTNGTKFNWVKGWSGTPTGNAIMFLDKKRFIPYRGINSLLLDGLYITYKQLVEFQSKHPEEKFEIPKGTKQDTVYFYKFTEKSEEKDGKKTTKTIPLMRFYNVFSINDITNLEKYFTQEKYEHTLTDTLLKADNIISDYCNRENVRFMIKDNSERCYYNLDNHSIVAPNLNQFKSKYEAYKSYMHELVHSTMTKLERETGGRFGDEKYSFEELVAEIGSEMICSYIGIEDEESFSNSIAYIQGWLSKLDKTDLGFIVKAANQAQKACDLILNINQENIELTA